MVNQTTSNFDVSILKTIGDKVSYSITELIKYLSNLGLTITSTTGRLISLTIILGLAYGSIKFLEKPIKYVFFILLVLLAISIGTSFIQ